MKITYLAANGTLTVSLNGDFIDYDNSGDDNGLLNQLNDKNLSAVTFNASQLKKWDSTLVVVLYELCRLTKKGGIKTDLSGLPQNLRKLIELALEVDRKPEQHQSVQLPFLNAIGHAWLEGRASVQRALIFIGQTFRSFGRLLLSQAVMRKVDFLFAMEESSYKAIGIVSLVSFMVGLILAFVGAIQLKTFGAQIYVASLVGIAMTRIMGAIMVGIIMAGRTGASYAATIGTMQVNEELDALKTMGISPIDFLVLPRITSLIINMPFLTILADFMGILGGAAVGIFMLDIAPPEYWKYTVTSLTLSNFLVGVFHGFVYGWVIAISGCYYGINSGRNADSVGKATTQAVVTAIVAMIVVTGILTWLFEVIGI